MRPSLRTLATWLVSTVAAVGGLCPLAFPQGNNPGGSHADPEVQDWSEKVERLPGGGRASDAEQVLRLVLETQPDLRPAKIRLASLLLGQGAANRVDRGLSRHLADGLIWEARSHYEDLTTRDPQDVEAWAGVAGNP